MIQAIALDDETPGLAVIENFCSQTDFVQLNKTFNQPSEALKYLQQFPVDLLFLDIQMPTITGLEFYKQVKQNTMVIFTTAYSQYAVEGFNLQAVDYLLKPFTFERFLQAANRAKDFYEYEHQAGKSTENFLFVRADYSLIKINVKDILLVEGLDDYLRIHLQNQKPVITRMTMKVMLEKLPVTDFVRVHRSFIVPFSRVSNVRNKTLMLENREVPIGASYEEEFMKRFKSA
jgi:DNA-binding LytR/AlgR family response regulator